MPLMFLQRLISSVVGKVFKNYLKTCIESFKFENQCMLHCMLHQCYRMLKLYFYFLKFFRNFKVVKKVLNIKTLGNNQNNQIMYLVSGYVAS